MRIHEERVGPWTTLRRILRGGARALYKALYFVTGSRQDAEELMQDAFLKLWERMGSDPDHRGPDRLPVQGRAQRIQDAPPSCGLGGPEAFPVGRASRRVQRCGDARRRAPTAPGAHPTAACRAHARRHAGVPLRAGGRHPRRSRVHGPVTGHPGAASPASDGRRCGMPDVQPAVPRWQPERVQTRCGCARTRQLRTRNARRARNRKAARLGGGGGDRGGDRAVRGSRDQPRQGRIGAGRPTRRLRAYLHRWWDSMAECGRSIVPDSPAPMTPTCRRTAR